MNTKNVESLNDKINELEKKKIEYLEVDDKAGVRRIEKQIEKIELEKELSDLNKIKEELNVYKKIVRNYPGILCEINRELTKMKGK